MVAWIGPTPVGWHYPVLVMLSRSPQVVTQLRYLARWSGLRAGYTSHAAGIRVHVEPGDVATVAYGGYRFGPVPVSPEWVATARAAEIVLMVDLMAVPDDLDMADYLEGHSDDVAVGVVPMAGAARVAECVPALTGAGVRELPDRPPQRRPRQRWEGE